MAFFATEHFTRLRFHYLSYCNLIFMFYNIKKSLKNIQIMKIGDISVERPDNETAIHDSSLTEVLGSRYIECIQSRG